MPFADVDLGDHAVAAGAQLVLHLHRFDDDERLTGGDRIAGLDEHADDFAGHRRRQPLRHRTRAPARTQLCGKHVEEGGARECCTRTRFALRLEGLLTAVEVEVDLHPRHVDEGGSLSGIGPGERVHAPITSRTCCRFRRAASRTYPL